MMAAKISLLSVMDFFLPKQPVSGNICSRSCWKWANIDPSKWSEDAAIMGSILFLLELYVWFYDCPGVCRNSNHHWIWQVRKDCLPARGAWIGIVSKVSHAPPLTVLLRSLQRRIVLSEPLWNPYFLTAGNTVYKISLVQIMAPYLGLRNFLHDL